VLQTRSVPTFEEFTLRAIALGIGEEEDLQSFLNLPSEVVHGVVSDLLTSRHLGVRPSGESPALRLTPSGEQLVKTLVETRAIEKELTYWVSGLSGNPISLASSDLLAASDLDLTPRLIFEPDDEMLTELSPADTDRFLEAQPVKSDSTLTLLTVISTASASKQFLEIGALLFESESDPSDLYLRVVVDGRSDQDLEQLLRETGIYEGLRLPSRIAEDRRRIDRALPPELLASRVEDLLIERLLAEIEAANAVAQDGNENDDAAEHRDSLLAELSSISVRRYGCDEALPALEAEIAAARGAVLFSTSRLWRIEERDAYHQKIDRLLTSGVVVTFECLADHMGKADSSELKMLEDAFAGRGLVVTPSKPEGEANFVSIDGYVLFAHSGNPFAGIRSSSARLGEDRPTVIRGDEEVAAFLAYAHGGDQSSSSVRRSTVDLIAVRRRTS
jgi:hypothetical protein